MRLAFREFIYNPGEKDEEASGVKGPEHKQRLKEKEIQMADKCAQMCSASCPSRKHKSERNTFLTSQTGKNLSRMILSLGNEDRKCEFPLQEGNLVISM